MLILYKMVSRAVSWAIYTKEDFFAVDQSLTAMRIVESIWSQNNEYFFIES